MYTSNEKSTGLDTLTALASGDLIIVGDVSDSGRAKAITETDFEDTTGITQLKTDVTQLQADVITIQGDITTINGDINNLQSQINNISASGGSGGGKPMTFALTDFGTETGLPLNGYSDTEALVYASGATVSFQDILGFTQSRDLTIDWAAATGIQGYVVLGSYLYVLVSSGSVLRVYRFSRLDLSLGGTLMTFSGATLTYNASVTMTSNGTDFFFNYDVGQSSDSFEIAKLTLSGTTLTYVAAVTCGATALQFTGKLAVDESGNIYGTNTGIFYQYDNTGALTETTGGTFSSITKLFNWQNTIYGSDSNSQVFTKLYLPDTDLNPSGETDVQNITIIDDFVNWVDTDDSSDDAISVSGNFYQGAAAGNIFETETNHPGIITITTTGGNAADVLGFIGGGQVSAGDAGGIGLIPVGNDFKFTYHGRSTRAGASFDTIIGLTDDTGSYDVYVRFNSVTSATKVLYTVGAGSVTSAINLPVSGTWFTLVFNYVASTTTLTITLDGQTVYSGTPIFADTQVGFRFGNVGGTAGTKLSTDYIKTNYKSTR